MKSMILIVLALFSISAFTTHAASASEHAGKPRSSHWVQLSQDGYSLKPREKADIYLLAGIDSKTHQVAITIFDLTGNACSKNETQMLGNVGTYKVDGTYIRFRGACINGSEIEQPFSDAGKDFINNRVNEEEPVTVDMGAGNVLHYDTNGFSAIKTKLLATEHAL